MAIEVRAPDTLAALTRRGRVARASAAFKSSRWVGLLFVLPIFGFFVVFRYWPMVETFILSLQRRDLITPTRWVGFQNYQQLFNDPQFINSLRVTAYFVLGTCIPLWVLSLGLALMMDKTFRGRTLFRVLIFLPSIIPAVVLPVLWRYLYHPYGLINTGIEALGFGKIDWLTSTKAVIPGFILASEWRFVPMFAIIYLAGLQGIPRSYHEAAEIDGAGAIRRFFAITLPGLKPTIAVVVIVSLTLTAKSLVLALLMTGGGPGNASTVLTLFIYQNGLVYFKMGYAAAASIILLAIMFTVTVVQLRILRTDDDS